MELTDAEVARWARQLILPGFDANVQATIRAARVHVVGAGAVAGPALLYLASAGVGTVYVDDAADVGPDDAAAWLYAAGDVGEPRLFAAMKALRGASTFTKARAHATGAMADAVLVCAPTSNLARVAAEQARRAGLPFVVAVADGDGGAVITVPRGEPCFTCASRPGSNLSPAPGAAAILGALAATELLLVLAGMVRGPGSGRRLELAAGRPSVTATQRTVGCDCATIY